MPLELSLAIDLTNAQRAGAGIAGTTFDPATKPANFTLSNGNLTATYSSGSGHQNVRATVGRTSGYFEVVPTGTSGTIGLCTAAYTQTDWIGSGTGSCGYLPAGTVFLGGASQAGTWATYTTSDVIGVCFKAGKIYFSKNGVWQNSADPSAGTGGLDISASITTALPAASDNAINDAITGRFTTGFTGSIPTGVTAWT